MDMSMVPVTFLVLFLIACVSLFLVYKYGIREKSYEEALAEQRLHTQALLVNKPKPKEKKNKKAARKTKDKERHEDESTKSSEVKEVEPLVECVRPQTPSKLHVEFKKEPEELPLVKENVPVVTAHKKKAKKEVRPILVHKDQVENIVDPAIEEVPTANHFEEIHPKDEFELLRSNSKEELLKPTKEKIKTKPQTNELKKKDKEEVKEEHSKEKTKVKEAQINEHPIKANEQVKTKVKSVETEPPVAEKENPKEAKPPSPSNAANPQANGLIVNTGKEKKKKKSEFNNLQQLAAEKEGANISLLLNLVRKAELSRSEVQILIDLLLNKQHEAPAVLDEWSEGKSDPVQKLKKQLAEKEKAFAEEQEALKGAQAKLREIRNEHLSERSQNLQKIRGLEEILQARQMEIQAINNRSQGQAQQFQQMQAQLNEELAAIQMQIQQYEIRLAQTQEAEGIMVQLRAELQALSEQNQQLRLELQRLAEEKEHQQNVIIQLNNYQEEMQQKTDHIRHLETNLKKNQDEYSKLEAVCQKNLKELRELEANKNHAVEELRALKSQKDESEAYINQLKADIQNLMQEKSLMEDRQVSDDVEEENKQHKVEILNLHNALSSMKSELQESEKKYKTELDISRNTVEKLESDLNEQKSKNDELRTRNWKVMEALNAAENRIKNSNKSEINIDKLTSEIETRQFEAQKEFLVRLFPEIHEIKSIKSFSKDWYSECGRHISVYIEHLKTQRDASPPSGKTSARQEETLAKLRNENLYLKSIIDETSERLNQIQNSVEQEEKRWRRQLAIKDEEIQQAREVISQRNENMHRLEAHIKDQQTEMGRLVEECRHLKNQMADTNSTAIKETERLLQEVDHLREQLHVTEQTKNGDVNSNPKPTNNCNSTNGPSIIQEGARLED